MGYDPGDMVKEEGLRESVKLQVMSELIETRIEIWGLRDGMCRLRSDNVEPKWSTTRSVGFINQGCC